jgi:hypothetical protein
LVSARNSAEKFDIETGEEASANWLSEQFDEISMNFGSLSSTLRSSRKGNLRDCEEIPG